MTTPSWFLDELAHVGSEHLDPTYVQGYDQKAGFDPGEDLAALQRHGLADCQTLVDLGAGTGSFALAAARIVPRVIAVDVSKPMLDELTRKFDQAELTNVDIVRGGFLTYDHQEPLADMVYTRHALHHLPDFWKAVALDRMADILKPGGVLYLRDLVYSCEPQEVKPIMEEWLVRAASTAEVGWTREELETHLREEYSTFSWLLEPLIQRAGFTIRDVRRDGPLYAAYTCTLQG
jgi:ubiquinone/menaquinone biosynthesis C-methylase UbiE